MNRLVIPFRFNTPTTLLTEPESDLLKLIGTFELPETTEPKWKILEPICEAYPTQQKQKSVRDALAVNVFGATSGDCKFDQVILDLGGPNHKETVDHNLLNGVAPIIRELVEDHKTSVVVFYPTSISPSDKMSLLFKEVIAKPEVSVYFGTGVFDLPQKKWTRVKPLLVPSAVA